MRHGLTVRSERHRILLAMHAWTQEESELADVSASAIARLHVDDAEELAQALLSECQDIRRQEMAEDALRYEEQVQHGQS